MTTLTTVYATDEDIALRIAADFPILCPRDQKLAAGSDGVFSASDPWTLLSPSVDFSACGLKPGHVVQLTKPIANFKPPGEALVVVSVAPGAVTLRRKGQSARAGQPPGPVTGLTGVEFAITTLGPQIERASYDLNRRYGIDDLVAGRRASDLYDPREVCEAAVLTVLARQYLAMSRETGDQRDPFAAKAGLAREELDDLLDRVVVHWGSPTVPGSSSPSTSRFGTRITR